MPNKEYIIFCDDSEVSGKYYSNFYGGVLVGSSQYDRITAHLNAEKQRLNLFGEVKWSKVTAVYLPKYGFFELYKHGLIGWVINHGPSSVAGTAEGGPSSVAALRRNTDQAVSRLHTGRGLRFCAGGRCFRFSA
jgi:hypothetical protein